MFCTWTRQRKPDWRLGSLFWVSEVRSVASELNREFLPLRCLPPSSIYVIGCNLHSQSIILHSPTCSRAPELAPRFSPFTQWRTSFLGSESLCFGFWVRIMSEFSVCLRRAAWDLAPECFSCISRLRTDRPPICFLVIGWPLLVSRSCYCLL